MCVHFVLLLCIACVLHGTFFWSLSCLPLYLIPLSDHGRGESKSNQFTLLQLLIQDEWITFSIQGQKCKVVNHVVMVMLF